MCNKPSWDQAPEWANYLAMDKDGEWYWFEDEPIKSITTWIDRSGKIEYHNETPIYDWEETLEKRPKIIFEDKLDD